MLKRYVLAAVSLWLVYSLADALSDRRRVRKRHHSTLDEGRWESEGGATRTPETP